jgi:hypothetical protein
VTAALTPALGFCTLVIKADGTMKTDKVFDVNAADTDFKAAVDGLAADEYIMVAVYENAFTAGKLTDPTKAALKLLGAANIDKLAKDDAYVFVGKKGRSDGQDARIPLITNGVTGVDLERTFYMDKSNLNVLQYAQS